MKFTFSLFIIFVSFCAFTQNEVKLSEENQSFSVGSKNSLVVTIPHGEAEFVEKMLQKELKDWNGKTSSSKSEFSMIQGTVKFMGEKAFDAYAKIISKSDNSIEVAFAIDLGGAYLSSREHQSQFKAMSEEIKKFAFEAANTCLDKHLDEENKLLDQLEKSLHKLERQKEKELGDIEDYKRKIAEAEKEIEENIKNQDKNKEETAAQKTKIQVIEKKKKEIR